MHAYIRLALNSQKSVSVCFLSAETKSPQSLCPAPGNVFQPITTYFWFWNSFVIGKVVLCKHSKAITLNYSVLLIINKWKTYFPFSSSFFSSWKQLACEHSTPSAIQSYRGSVNINRDSWGMVVNTCNLRLVGLKQRWRDPGPCERHNKTLSETKQDIKLKGENILKDFLHTDLL